MKKKKGVVYLKLKFRPVTTHNYVNEASGDVFLIHTTLLVIHGRKESHLVPIEWKPVVAVYLN